MPIRLELRKLYTAEAGWPEIRARILARAGNRCERCCKPNGAKILVTRGGYWSNGTEWFNERGESNGFNWPTLRDATAKRTRGQLHIAHLNFDPTDNRDENLAALCPHCHAKNDVRQHNTDIRRTRAEQTGQQWLPIPLMEARV